MISNSAFLRVISCIKRKTGLTDAELCRLAGVSNNTLWRARFNKCDVAEVTATKFKQAMKEFIKCHG